MADDVNKEVGVHESKNQVFDPNKATVPELKDFLRDKGVPVSGLKLQLTQRALGVLTIGTESVKSVRNRDEVVEKQRYVDKYITPLGEILPPQTCLKTGWTDTLDALPPFSDNELYNYLVLSKQRTCDGANVDYL